MAISIEEATRTEGFAFEFDPSRAFASFTTNKEVAENLSKWGLPHSSTVGQHYGCDTMFRRGMAAEYLKALFNDPSFRTHFMVTDTRGGLRLWSPIAKVDAVDFVPVRATATTLEVFDRFKEAGLVRESGGIARCMDVFLPSGATVANLLRAYFMIPADDEDNMPEELRDIGVENVLSDEQRSEFLVHILHRVMAGGPLCQWDDDFEPYRDAARALYKDMVVVGKSVNDEAAEGGAPALEVQSQVFQVRGVTMSDGTDSMIFPREGDDNTNYLYVSIHPHRRALTVWYHGAWSAF